MDEPIAEMGMPITVGVTKPAILAATKLKMPPVASLLPTAAPIDSLRWQPRIPLQWYPRVLIECLPSIVQATV
ncbi:hypothetical protein R75465_08110 [Paraburkholderia aspalathi]|nr:hypothetical protein R75465_08110 [Paraburkholderia aspalathi]